jgi:protein-disulfide isomerase
MRNSDAPDVTFCLSLLLRTLETKVSKSSVKEIERHPYFPSLLSMSEFLKIWKVKNICARLNESQFKDIVFPAITKVDDLGFVVLKEVKANQIIYSSISGEITQNFSDFFKVWSGVVLMVEPTAKSGEPNYASNLRLEILEQVRRAAVLSITALLFFSLCWVWPSFVLPFLIITCALCLSGTLFMQALGQETTLGQAVCKSGTSTDCNKVINSKLAKVYGDISLAEIAFVFFVSLLSVQITSLVNNQGHNFLPGWLSFASVPVAVFSIYYQWRVLKTWCLLCLGVVACIWGLAGFYGYHIQHWSYGWPALQAFGVGVAVPILLWFLVRTSIIQAARVPSLEKGLNKFRKSLSVFEALTAQKHELQPEPYLGDLELGNKEADSVITIVTNPTCGPCVRAHQFIENWLEEHGANLKVIIRFAVNPADTGVSGTVAKYLVSLGLDGDDRLQAALHAWYAIEKPKLQDWQNRFACEIHPETHERLAQHSNWCRANLINATPTIFFNGRQIPEEFSLSDFEYFLRLKMVEVEMETETVV